MSKITSSPMSLQRKEFVSPDFWLWLDDGHTPEMLLTPAYWAHHAMKLRQNGIVHVRSRDGAYYGQWLIIATGDGWAKVMPIVELNVDAKADPIPEQEVYKVDHTAEGWRVIHRVTQKVLVRKLANRSDAEQFVTAELAKVS